MPGLPEKTIFYFGTFNPVHTGHLLIAQAALNQLSGTMGIQSVTFVPSPNPPHRAGHNDMLDVRHRFYMVRLATASNPAFRVSDLELHRKGKSYTIDSVRCLIELGLAEAPVPIIIGSDALAGLPTWREAETLAGLAYFLQAPRPGYPFVTAIELNGQTLHLNSTPIDVPLSGISSTWIRSMTTRNDLHALRYALPDPVLRYIRDNALYVSANN